MQINSITLYNYRLYQGTNSIRFNNSEKRNLYIVSGQNGFGKTTFLQSLLWCLYGRLMLDVDESIKREIQNRGGYNSLLINNLNINSKNQLSIIPQSYISTLIKTGYSHNDEQIKKNATYYVSIDFSDVYIPSTPCRSLKITRSYDLLFNKETIEILIDGVPNELTTDIGNDVFINDFILNKDIARFFFFDSEKIVALAETNSIEEKRRLSSAYNEVLGVKKYEDLKKNLENLRLRLRKKSADIESKNKLNALLFKQKSIQEKSVNIGNDIETLEESLSSLKTRNDELQVQLLREGNGISIDELHRQEAVVSVTKQKDIEYKQKLKIFLEYAPFAIVGDLFKTTKIQIEHDFANHKSIQEIQHINSVVETITRDFNDRVDLLINNENERNSLKTEILKLKENYCQKCDETEQLLNVTKENFQEFIALFNHITSTYKAEFEHLTDNYKKNRQILEKASRKIANMHSREDDDVIKSIRKKKNEVEKSIQTAENRIRSLYELKGELSKELATTNKIISELSKKVSVDDTDTKKDILCEQLTDELDNFLCSLKQEKKISLERRIKETLNSLMHKTDFVGNVKVRIINDGLDIDLYNQNGNTISKDSLSKGEQQLYATSLLKALVDESGIEFPIFIDSPLQKFDKSHSNKIITEFYPSISKQVVLFPLLHKELTKQELEIMRPLISATYLIRNDNSHSYFQKVEPNKLMEE